jgi:hypothetical protein
MADNAHQRRLRRRQEQLEGGGVGQGGQSGVGVFVGAAGVIGGTTTANSASGSPNLSLHSRTSSSRSQSQSLLGHKNATSAGVGGGAGMGAGPMAPPPPPKAAPYHAHARSAKSRSSSRSSSGDQSMFLRINSHTSNSQPQPQPHPSRPQSQSSQPQQQQRYAAANATANANGIGYANNTSALRRQPQQQLQRPNKVQSQSQSQPSYLRSRSQTHPPAPAPAPASLVNNHSMSDVESLGSLASKSGDDHDDQEDFNLPPPPPPPKRQSSITAHELLQSAAAKSHISSASSSAMALRAKAKFRRNRSNGSVSSQSSAASTRGASVSQSPPLNVNAKHVNIAFVNSSSRKTQPAPASSRRSISADPRAEQQDTTHSNLKVNVNADDIDATPLTKGGSSSVARSRSISSSLFRSKTPTPSRSKFIGGGGKVSSSSSKTKDSANDNNKAKDKTQQHNKAPKLSVATVTLPELSPPRSPARSAAVPSSSGVAKVLQSAMLSNQHKSHSQSQLQGIHRTKSGTASSSLAFASGSSRRQLVTTIKATTGNTSTSNHKANANTLFDADEKRRIRLLNKTRTFTKPQDLPKLYVATVDPSSRCVFMSNHHEKRVTLTTNDCLLPPLLQQLAHQAKSSVHASTKLQSISPSYRVCQVQHYLAQSYYFGMSIPMSLLQQQQAAAIPALASSRRPFMSLFGRQLIWSPSVSPEADPFYGWEDDESESENEDGDEDGADASGAHADEAFKNTSDSHSSPLAAKHNASFSVEKKQIQFQEQISGKGGGGNNKTGETTTLLQTHRPNHKRRRYYSLRKREHLQNLPSQPPQLSVHRNRLPMRSDVGFPKVSSQEMQQKMAEQNLEAQWEEAVPRLSVLVSARDVGDFSARNKAAAAATSDASTNTKSKRARNHGTTTTETVSSNSTYTTTNTKSMSPSLSASSLSSSRSFLWHKVIGLDAYIPPPRPCKYFDEVVMAPNNNTGGHNHRLQRRRRPRQRQRPDPTSMFAPPLESVPAGGNRAGWKPRPVADRPPGRHYVLVDPVSLDFVDAFKNKQQQSAMSLHEPLVCSLSLYCLVHPHPPATTKASKRSSNYKSKTADNNNNNNMYKGCKISEEFVYPAGDWKNAQRQSNVLYGAHHHGHDSTGRPRNTTIHASAFDVEVDSPSNGDVTMIDIETPMSETTLNTNFFGEAANGGGGAGDGGFRTPRMNEHGHGPQSSAHSHSQGQGQAQLRKRALFSYDPLAILEQSQQMLQQIQEQQHQQHQQEHEHDESSSLYKSAGQLIQEQLCLVVQVYKVAHDGALQPYMANSMSNANVNANGMTTTTTANKGNEYTHVSSSASVMSLASASVMSLASAKKAVNTPFKQLKRKVKNKQQGGGGGHPSSTKKAFTASGSSSRPARSQQQQELDQETCRQKAQRAFHHYGTQFLTPLGFGVVPLFEGAGVEVHTTNKGASAASSNINDNDNANTTDQLHVDGVDRTYKWPNGCPRQIQLYAYSSAEESESEGSHESFINRLSSIRWGTINHTSGSSNHESSTLESHLEQDSSALAASMHTTTSIPLRTPSKNTSASASVSISDTAVSTAFTTNSKSTTKSAFKKSMKKVKHQQAASNSKDAFSSATDENASAAGASASVSFSAAATSTKHSVASAAHAHGRTTHHGTTHHGDAQGAQEQPLIQLQATASFVTSFLGADFSKALEPSLFEPTTHSQSESLGMGGTPNSTTSSAASRPAISPVPFALSEKVQAQNKQKLQQQLPHDGKSSSDAHPNPVKVLVDVMGDSAVASRRQHQGSLFLGRSSSPSETKQKTHLVKLSDTHIPAGYMETADICELLYLPPLRAVSTSTDTHHAAPHHLGSRVNLLYLYPKRLAIYNVPEEESHKKYYTVRIRVVQKEVDNISGNSGGGNKERYASETVLECLYNAAPGGKTLVQSLYTKIPSLWQQSQSQASNSSTSSKSKSKHNHSHSSKNKNQVQWMRDEIKVRLPEVLDETFFLHFSLYSVTFKSEHGNGNGNMGKRIRRKSTAIREERQDNNDDGEDDDDDDEDEDGGLQVVQLLESAYIPLVNPKTIEPLSKQHVTTFIPDQDHEIAFNGNGNMNDVRLTLGTRLVSNVHVTNAAAATVLQNMPLMLPPNINGNKPLQGSDFFHHKCTLQDILRDAPPQAILPHFYSLMYVLLRNVMLMGAQKTVVDVLEQLQVSFDASNGNVTVAFQGQGSSNKISSQGATTMEAVMENLGNLLVLLQKMDEPTDQHQDQNMNIKPSMISMQAHISRRRKRLLLKNFMDTFDEQVLRQEPPQQGASASSNGKNDMTATSLTDNGGAVSLRDRVDTANSAASSHDDRSPSHAGSDIDENEADWNLNDGISGPNSPTTLGFSSPGRMHLASVRRLGGGNNGRGVGELSRSPSFQRATRNERTFARRAYGVTKMDRMRAEAEIWGGNDHFGHGHGKLMHMNQSHIFDDDATVMTNATWHDNASSSNKHIVSASNLISAEHAHAQAALLPSSSFTPIPHYEESTPPINKTSNIAKDPLNSRFRSTLNALLAPCVAPSTSVMLASTDSSEDHVMALHGANLQEDEDATARYGAIMRPSNNGAGTSANAKAAKLCSPGSDVEDESPNIDDLVAKLRHLATRKGLWVPHLATSLASIRIRGVNEESLLLDQLPLILGDAESTGGEIYLYERLLVVWLKLWSVDMTTAEAGKSKSSFSSSKKGGSSALSAATLVTQMDFFVPLCLKSLALRCADHKRAREHASASDSPSRGGSRSNSGKSKLSVCFLDAAHMKMLTSILSLWARSLVEEMATHESDSALSSSSDVSLASSSEASPKCSMEGCDAAVDFFAGLLPLVHVVQISELLQAFVSTLCAFDNNAPSTSNKKKETSSVGGAFTRTVASRQLRIQVVRKLSSMPCFVQLNYPLKYPQYSTPSRCATSTWLHQLQDVPDVMYVSSLTRPYAHGGGDGMDRFPEAHWLAEQCANEGFAICAACCDTIFMGTLKRHTPATDSKLGKREKRTLQSLAVDSIAVVYESLIRRHAIDMRFQGVEARSRVAAMFVVPVFENSLYSVHWLEKMESTHKVRLLWLLSFLHVLQEAPEFLIREQLRCYCDPKVCNVCPMDARQLVGVY